MKKLLTIILTVAGCLLATNFLWSPNGAEIAKEEDHDPHDDFLPFSKDLVEANHIEIEKATTGKLKQLVRAPGHIAIISDKQAHILPKAPGIAISAYKNLGEQVSADEVVAVLESKEMAEAKANYLTVLKKEQLAFTIFQREKTLYEKNITSLQDFNNSENSHEAATIELELARQKLYTLGLTTNDIDQLPNEPSDKLRIYEIRSPIAGKVVARHITPGEFITNDHEVFEIADLSKVWAEINVFSQDRQHVKEGQIVTIKTSNGHAVQGKVSYLSPVINQDTRTSTALMEIDNESENWLPGSFVQAEFITDEIDIPLMVKRNAIQNIDGTNILFISSADGFAVRPVTIGRSDEENCELLAGLTDGEEYACKNTFLLKADLKKDEAEHMD